MRSFSFVSRALCGLALGSAFATLSCGNGDSGANGSSGASGMSSGGSGGAGGSSGASGASGAGGTSGTSGSGSGGTTGGNGGSGGSSGAGGAAAGSGASGGDAGGGGAGGSTGGAGGDGGGGSAGSSTGGSAGQASGGDAGTSAAGGSAGGGGLTGAVPSDGCGMAVPMTGERTIDATREYILRLPDGYDPDVPHRIVFAFHGAQGSAVQVDTGAPANTDSDPTGPFYGIMDELPDTIFVAGQADGTWDTSSDKDVNYVNAILDELEGVLCIDTTRVFATGFSMGAMMTINNVGCKMADVFRAIAPMSGSLATCPGDAAIPYWASHGTNDGTIDISRGEEARDEFVGRNGCDDTTVAATPEGCVTYQGCDAGYPVSWCVFEGVHQPPPFAGPAIAAFFEQF